MLLEDLTAEYSVEKPLMPVRGQSQMPNLVGGQSLFRKLTTRKLNMMPSKFRDGDEYRSIKLF
jgi:hypothetical protein